MVLQTNHLFHLLLALAGGLLLVPTVGRAEIGKSGAVGEENWRYGQYERRMWCPYWVPPQRSRPGKMPDEEISDDTWSEDPLEWGVVDGLVEIRPALPLEVGAVRAPLMIAVSQFSLADGTRSAERAAISSLDPRFTLRLASLELDGGFSMFKVHEDPGEVAGQASVNAKGMFRPGNVFVSATYSNAASKLPDLYRRYFGFTGVAHLSPKPHEYDDAGAGNARKRRAHALAVQVLPFQRARFANFHSLQLIADLRYEFMGCHGPFIHLRAGLDWYDVSWDLDTDAAVRLAASVGARPWFSSDTRVFVEYVLLAALDADPGHQQIFNLGVQWTGRPHQTGWFRPTLGVSLGLPVGPFSGYTIGIDLTLAVR